MFAIPNTTNGPFFLPALLVTDGNFGFILSKYLQSPGDPNYGWISKNGGWEKRRQMFGMCLFNACYFSQFVFAMSLVAC